MKIEEACRVKVFNLKPGDKVLIECDVVLSDAAIEYIRTAVRKWLDNENIPVLVLDAGLQLKIVREKKETWMEK